MVTALLQDPCVNPFWRSMCNYDFNLSIHSYGVARLSAKIAQDLGYTDEIIREIVIGALLHDFGKIYIPKEILTKPESLNSSEYEIIKKHPALGYDSIVDFGFSDIVTDICLHHHEFENGTGYPDHCTYMHKETKIVSLADKYDAIRSLRSYKLPNTHENTLYILESERNKYLNVDDIYSSIYSYEYSNTLNVRQLVEEAKIRPAKSRSVPKSRQKDKMRGNGHNNKNMAKNGFKRFLRRFD